MKKFLLYYLGVVAIVISGMIANPAVYAEGKTAEEILPEIYIKAVNPGYTVDGKSNTGEMVEIARRGKQAEGEADKWISLAGVTVRYTTSGGSSTDLVKFPENSYFAGESIILRLASSPESELAAINYTKTLAYEGSLTLLRNDEVVDAVCWTGKDGCLAKFKSGGMTSLVRDTATGEFVVKAYEPIYVEGNYLVDSVEDGKGEATVVPQCRGLVFSEVLSYYAETQSEQFIEFHNTGAEQILMDGCMIRYKNKTHLLSGVIKADGYVARYLTDFSITKNPNNSNTLELIDTDGAVLDKLEYPNGQRKGASWAFIGYDGAGEELWKTTYKITPGEPNIYQEYKTCEVGKVINEATGNCVKVAEVTTKVCADGQYLNTLTGRCKKFETAASAKVCKEGYEINPETGRCRKIKENDGANYALETETYDESSSFIALYAIIGVMVAGIAYVVYEFRHEIAKLFRKVWLKFRW